MPILEKPPENLRIDARSVLTIDPLGRLVRFDSAVRLEPFNETIGLKGVVEEGRKLQLAVRIGNKPIQTPKEIQLPSDALLSDVLFAPDAAAGLGVEPDLDRAGLQPFHAGQAVGDHSRQRGAVGALYVERDHGERLVRCLPRRCGQRHGRRAADQGRGLVRPDGVVLQQKVMLFDAPLLFVRMTDDEARKLVERAGPQWWSLGNDPQGRNYD